MRRPATFCCCRSTSSPHSLRSSAGRSADAAHDDADVADAATAADADAETDGDVHDVRRLGASTTDVGTHRPVSDLLPEAPPEDLVLDCDGRVKAGSAVGLIERLASHKFDHRFCAALLLTYRSFYSPRRSCALVARYHIQPPAAVAGTRRHDVWVNQRQRGPSD